LDINSFSYATKKFVFSDETLRSIIGYLEKAYSKKIVLENDLIGNCKMTSSFDNKSIEYILDVITTTLDITYMVKGNIIYIGGVGHEGC
jgi:ferric-dicitrate binding protein FerR (iron transport regulator)